ncbi:hypothetical protein [Reinekea thalattae]|uniref:DNA repair protein n=1 Tax=Reinekea thalattae TaxID=2593301 RepID=A0A5C8Z904_9GAMM|nr:hypothetical protein [Reinekea thalattae]TXR53326.1 hypothetical protein FME95_01775 [Reinekea thalattae]
MAINNDTLLAILGFAFLVAIVIGVLVSQANHRAQKLRNEQIQKLRLQQKRLNNLLNLLPAGYLSTELRDFIYQALQQNIKSQIMLSKINKELLQSELDQATEAREKASNNPPPEKSIRLTEEQVGLFRSLLKSLYQFIRRNYETGRLNKEHAEKIILQVEIKLVETAVEFFAGAAKELNNTKRYRQAQSAYQQALDAISSSAHAEQFHQQEVKIRSELNNMLDQWNKTKEENAKATANTLEDNVDSFVDDDWKKKQEYD